MKDRRKVSIVSLLLAGLVTTACGQTLSLSRVEADSCAVRLRTEWTARMRERYAPHVQDCKLTYDSLTLWLWGTTYGDRPADGYSLYISLHGGGNAPQALNDQQWDNQKVLYAPKQGVYMAPRAPWNDWDMWFKPGIDSLYAQLVQMSVACFGVNPDRVYLMGYSAGGDGVWRMAPRMADTWAAASMMAGHPGDVSLVNLRNLPFMIWCGEQDAAYNRNVLCAERGMQMDSLQQADAGGYVHQTHIVKGKGHWMDRVDTVAVDWMSQFRRNPYPDTIVWRQEEVVRRTFYWIEAPQDELRHGREVRLAVKGNVIDISRCDYSALTLYLNDLLVNLDRPVTVRLRGKKVFKGKVPRTEQNLRRTLADRNDLSYMFPACISLAMDSTPVP